jgi:UDP-2-acetamido-2,6-beta-L-arabino-hexul-4-ose reductase
VSERLLITGAHGFLGWHVRVLARSLGLPPPLLVTRQSGGSWTSLVNESDRVIHLAGVNRGPDDSVRSGNIRAAQNLADALRTCVTPPKTVTYANSVQSGNGTPYGDGKATAAVTLAEAARWVGSSFVDVKLPNLFGEHGRPRYNSVVATFCGLIADEAAPEVREDKSLLLLHATDAAAMLLGLPAPAEPTQISVQDIARRLTRFDEAYRRGVIPELPGRFDVRLFNTYRSHLFSRRCQVSLVRRADQRGELIEVVRSGSGQSFVSTTVPGATRGQHYHLAKIERFAVLRGEALIRLRRLLNDEVVTIRVTGDEPVAVDMPTMWAHEITNVGRADLLTLFWANEHYDPAHPDTYPEVVT